MRFGAPMLLLTLACGAPAHAAGLNLSWSDCGSAGTKNLDFACMSEAGLPHILVASVVPPAGIGRFVGADAVLDIQFEGNGYPSWWELGQGCRAGRISANFDFTSGPYSCEDFWKGQGQGGFQFDERRTSGNRALLRVIVAVAPQYEGSLMPGREYYMFQMSILNAGTGSCADCKRPACIQFSRLRLAQPAGTGDHVLTERQDLNVATWQGGITAPDGDLDACRADAVRNQTWGQIKNLYR